MITDRRRFVSGVATLAISGLARADDMPRVAALGWASGQTLLALGVVPLAMPELDRYAHLVVDPPAPASVRELGLRSEPNLELLARLEPSLLVTESGAEISHSLLQRIAPVTTFNALAPERKPIDVATEATFALADRLGRRPQAQSYRAALDQRLNEAKERLAHWRDVPLCIVSDIFANRALVFGGNGLYQDVLDRIGLTNAFHGATSSYGHTTVGLEVLAALPRDTQLLILTARVPSIDAALAMRPLWRAVPYVRERHVTLLSDILFYGGLPSAHRFVNLLIDRLGPATRHG